MEWVHVTEDVEAALDEVKGGGDQGPAIVAATLVDGILLSFSRSSFTRI